MNLSASLFVMKVYVAGKFQKKDLVREVYRRIKDLGYEVAYDWTTHDPIKPYAQNAQLAAQYAQNELEGIADSDVFIYLSDQRGTTLPMEFGAALMRAKTHADVLVYAVGEFNDKSPWFFNELVVRKDSVDEVIEELSEL